MREPSSDGDLDNSMYGVAARRSPNGRSFKQWIYNMIHTRDIFAKPITLNFNKKPSFATVPGGLCSILAISLLLCFCLVEMINFHYTGRIMNDSINIRNIQFKQSRAYNASTNQLNLLFNIGTVDDDILKNGSTPAELQKELRRYVRAQYMQIDSYDVNSNISYVPCNQFLDMTNKTNEEKWVLGDYQCPNISFI